MPPQKRVLRSNSILMDRGEYSLRPNIHLVANGKKNVTPKSKTVQPSSVSVLESQRKGIASHKVQFKIDLFPLHNIIYILEEVVNKKTKTIIETNKLLNSEICKLKRNLLKCQTNVAHLLIKYDTVNTETTVLQKQWQDQEEAISKLKLGAFCNNLIDVSPPPTPRQFDNNIEPQMPGERTIANMSPWAPAGIASQTIEPEDIVPIFNLTSTVNTIPDCVSGNLLFESDVRQLIQPMHRLRETHSFSYQF